MQSLPLYASCLFSILLNDDIVDIEKLDQISCLFSILLNDDIVDIEKLDGICSPTFVADGFLGLILHPSHFSIKHSRSS